MVQIGGRICIKRNEYSDLTCEFEKRHLFPDQSKVDFLSFLALQACLLKDCYRKKKKRKKSKHTHTPAFILKGKKIKYKLQPAFSSQLPVEVMFLIANTIC